MQGTGVGPWMKLTYEKCKGGASFRLDDTSLVIALGCCDFVDVKIGNQISEACFIHTVLNQHQGLNNGKPFCWEEVWVIHPDGNEHELVHDGFYLRANYDAANRPGLKREYHRRRELNRLKAEKEELERQIAEVASGK